MLCKKYKITPIKIFTRILRSANTRYTRCENCAIYRKYNQCTSIIAGILCDRANNGLWRNIYVVIEDADKKI